MHQIRQNDKMLYSHPVRTPSQIWQKQNENFSFIEGFPDQKQEKTTSNSLSKHSDFQTNSCCTCGVGTDYQKGENDQFFSQDQEELIQMEQSTNLDFGLFISKQINYVTPKEYEGKLQNLLNETQTAKQNKAYLRLVILDKQFEKDERLSQYFQWAIEQYRIFKEQHLVQNFNSALDSSDLHI